MSNDGAAPHALPITTTFELPGFRVVESRGACFGLIVRSMGIAKGVTSAFRSLRQGENPEYTQLLAESRNHAMDRLVENAQALGGNAIIGMRFDSAEVGDGLIEIVAYGTAVIVAAHS